MAENMAKQEKAPIVPIPTIDKPKGLSRRTLIKGLAATGIVAGAGALGYVLTRPGEQSVTPPVTAQPSAAASELPTTAPTVKPTEKPTPSPTERPLTDQEKIDLARKVQQEAQAIKELRIPLSEALEKLGAKVEEVYVPQTNAYFLRISGLPDGKEVSFPSLIDGVVIQAGRINRNTTTIKTQIGSSIVEYAIPNTGSLLVNSGVKISLADPLFSLIYSPEDPTQKGYEQAGVGATPSMIIKIFARSVSDAENVSNLRLESNIIKKASGEPLSIPTISR